MGAEPSEPIGGVRKSIGSCSTVATSEEGVITEKSLCSRLEMQQKRLHSRNIFKLKFP